jgi:hypothetical protein
MYNLSSLNKKLIVAVLLSLVVAILIPSGLVKATALFTDDFELYDLENFYPSGQGGWSAYYNYDYSVVADAVNCNSGQCIEKLGPGYLWKNVNPGLPSGTLVFKFNPYDPTATTSGVSGFGIGSFNTHKGWDQADTICGGILVNDDFDTNEIQLFIWGENNATTSIYLAPDEQVDLGFQWDLNATSNIRFYLVDHWTEWHTCGYSRDNIEGFSIMTYSGNPSSWFYFDDFGAGPPTGPNITINYPLNNAELSAEFSMDINYDLTGEDWDRLMIVFEDWDASSTCPHEDDPNYQTQFDLYFNQQSFPYFSDFFSTSTGTTSIAVDSMDAGTYNCNKCVFINESLGTMSEYLCDNYTIKILAGILPGGIPENYLPFATWQEYYASNSERFTTSTPLFSTLSNILQPLINTFGSFILYFNNFFDPAIASEKGALIGNAISEARGYLETIDNFFGDLPISWAFLLFLLTLAVVIVLKIVNYIRHIFAP